MKTRITNITMAIILLAGTLLVPAQSVSAAKPDAPTEAPLRDLVTTNDNNEIITYSGTWTHNTEQVDRLFGDDHTSATTGDYAQLTFTGASISLIVTTGPTMGEADIYLDTVFRETVDLYSATEATQFVAWNLGGFTAAAHAFKVVVKGTKNVASAGYTVNVDAFRFTDTADAAPPGSNEIQCYTPQWHPTETTCTQMTTQHITLVGNLEDDHVDPRWELLSGGVGTIYARVTALSVKWQTNGFSGSGTQTFFFDVRKSGGTGAVSQSAGSFWPNATQTVNLQTVTTQEVVSGAGVYESGTIVTTNPVKGEPLYNYWTTYVLDLQTTPFASDCIQQYSGSITNGPYVIDPTEDEPSVGVDEQAQNVTGGSLFLVRIGGHGWHNNSSADEFQAEYTFPGLEYPYTWTNFADVPCVQAGEGYYKYSAIIEAPAGALNLLIRVHDQGGVFTDNYMDANEFFIFTISEVALTGTLSCEQQYTFDEEVDWVAMASVDASLPYVEAVDVEGELPLVEGDWYVIQITGGMWQDDGAPPDRFDARFSWGNSEDGGATGDVDWRFFGAGGDSVYCSTYTDDYATIYVQAEGPVPAYHPAGTLPPPPRLWLRVNDEALTFSENTGALIVHIYHADFSRVPTTCETTYGIQGLVGTSEIPGSAENGVIIAAATDLTASTMGGFILNTAAWYMLETTGGPWGYVGSSSSRSYNVQVEWGGQWVDIENWSESFCNVAVDGLGHRRLYFNTPHPGSTVYKFRVADTSEWFNNIGRMKIDLYGAYDMVVSLPDGSCDYDHDEFPFLTRNIAANDSNGDGVGTLSSLGLYAMQLVGNPSWSEQSGSAALYDMEISVDNGGTWKSLPNGYAGVLCYYNDGTDLWFFMNGVDPTSEFGSVRFRVASETFTNNTGGMTVNVYGATEGDYVDPGASCLDGLAAYVLDDYIPIDVRAEEGEDIPIQTAWTTDESVIGFLVKIDWNGSNYWMDGETESQHRDAALSRDNAATWGPLDPTNADLICATIDEIGYASAYFQIADGDKWKIRVNDIGSATFSDNGGQLAYKLYAVTEGGPVDCIVDTDNPECIDWSQIPSGILINGVDICEAAILQPVAPTTIDIPEWLNYVAGWVVYAGEMVMAFGAWCPRHNDALASILEMFRSREPLATLAALRNLLVVIQTNLQAYNWSDTGAETSGLESASGGGDAADSIIDRILPAVTGPWAGGPLIQMASWTGSIPYSDCINDFGDFIPNTDLVSGICFVSANAREVGLFWFLQIMLDITAVVLLIVQFKNSLNQLAETMAGGPTTGGGGSADD